MRLPRSAFLGVLGVLPVLAAACGGGAAHTTGGQGGAGGAAQGSTAASSTTSVVAVTVGVGGSGGSGGGAGGAPDIGQPSTMYPAPHADSPFVQDFGGPTVAAPKIVPIFFEGELPSVIAQVTDFENKVGATMYWAAVTAEYGVAPAVALPVINVPEIQPSTVDDSTIQTWLGGKLNGNDPAYPPADGNTIYVLHYPAGTTITSNGAKSCASFGGYHSDFALDAAHGAQQVAYAVIPRCGNFDGLAGIDALTGAESHEIIEASTDPFPMVDPAYATIDDQHLFWERFLGGGEVGDMCVGATDAFTKFSELPYTVQRTWSNASAKAGHDPCQPPLPGEVYFNATPVMADTIVTSIMGQSLEVKGVKIPVGKSKTIDVQLFSDGDTGGPWTVEADDTSAAAGSSPNLTLALDATQGQNGQTLHLTITVMTAAKHNTETFVLKSTLGQQQNAWYGIVGN
jgi:hypothetical protein